MAVIAASLEHARLADPEHHVTTERNTQISCIVSKKPAVTLLLLNSVIVSPSLSMK